jgi:CRP-like cAMP-binding protein
MIKPDAALSVLRGHQWIHNFPWQHIEILAGLAEEVHFVPGATIFRQGELSDIFYLITGGTVMLEAMMDGMPTAVQSVHQGAEIGWSALMDDGVRHFTAKAATEVYALALAGPKLHETCERNPQFGYGLMKHLLIVVAERLDAAHMQLLQATHKATSR